MSIYIYIYMLKNSMAQDVNIRGSFVNDILEVSVLY